MGMINEDSPIHTGGAPEVDSIVGAVDGIVMADGAGNITLAVEGVDYYAPGGVNVVDVDVVDALTIVGGTVNNTVIGGVTPVAGAFTTLSASGLLSPNGGVTLGAATHLLLPSHNDAVTPTLAFGDGDTGFYETAGANEIGFSANGAWAWTFKSSAILGSNGAGPLLYNRTATATVPIYTFRTDSNTGLGRAAAGQLSLIVDGVEGIRITEDTTILINMNGWLAMAEQAGDPAALADHAFLYAKDVGGTGNMFVADAAADDTQISPHNFELFTPDPNEAYPWSYYSENKALGKRINVDMAGAIRAIETLSGKSFIYYEDIEKSVDLEAVYKEQWKQEYIKDNTVEVEASKVEAFELVEVDEPIVPREKIDENIVGYELINGEVKPTIETIWKTEKVQRSELKEDIQFNTNDGRFYKVTKPTIEEAEVAASADFVFTPPAWMIDRLEGKVTEPLTQEQVELIYPFVPPW